MALTPDDWTKMSALLQFMKEDLATKDDVANLATKIAELPTKEDLQKAADKFLEPLNKVSRGKEKGQLF